MNKVQSLVYEEGVRDRLEVTRNSGAGYNVKGVILRHYTGPEDCSGGKLGLDIRRHFDTLEKAVRYAEQTMDFADAFMQARAKNDDQARELDNQARELRREAREESEHMLNKWRKTNG